MTSPSNRSPNRIARLETAILERLSIRKNRRVATAAPHNRIARQCLRRTVRNGNRESGLILIVVLLAVATLSLLVSAFNASLRNSAHIARNELAIANAEGILEAGIAIAAARMMSTDPLSRWEPGSEPHTVDFAGSRLVILIEDLNGRVDLNLASEVVLEGLLAQVADNPRQVRLALKSILERRKSGLATTKRPAANSLRPEPESSETTDSATSTAKSKADSNSGARGASSQTAASQQSTFNQPGREKSSANSSDANELGRDDALEEEAKTGNFVATAELFGLANVTPRLAQRLQPFVTVHAKSGRINALSAPPTVLRAIPGITAEDARRIVKLRDRGAAGRRTLLSMLANLENFIELTNGPAYSVKVRLTGNSDLNGFAAQAIIGPSLDKNAPYRVLSWQDWSLDQHQQSADRQSQQGRAGGKTK
ncbi:MAG: general secretion pathway protein GspK [Alphaproteobacteria bacterium]|nr:general secretion pathway protein GspK [Alphaproteobacteria bacterium]